MLTVTPQEEKALMWPACLPVYTGVLDGAIVVLLLALTLLLSDDQLSLSLASLFTASSSWLARYLLFFTLKKKHVLHCPKLLSWK